MDDVEVFRLQDEVAKLKRERDALRAALQMVWDKGYVHDYAPSVNSDAMKHDEERRKMGMHHARCGLCLDVLMESQHLKAQLAEARAWIRAAQAMEKAWFAKPREDDYPACVTCGERNAASLPWAQCRECDIDGYPAPYTRALAHPSSPEAKDSKP